MEGSSESVSFEPEVELRERTRERREVEQEVEQSLRMSRKFDQSSSFATDNTCARCGKNVFAIERLQVDGLNFHSGCFTCDSCPTKLTHSDYHMHEHRFYCTQHYLGATKGRTTRSSTIGTPRSEETSTETCTMCGRRVVDFEKIEVNGKPYHRPCFACHKCKEPLDMDAYEELDGQFFCHLHFVKSKQRIPANVSKKEEKKAKKEEKKAKRISISGSPKAGRGLYPVAGGSSGKKVNTPPVARKDSVKADEPEAGPDKKKKKGILKQLSRGRKENKDAVREMSSKEGDSKAMFVEALNALDDSPAPVRTPSANSSAAADAFASPSRTASDDSSRDLMEASKELPAAPAAAPVASSPGDAAGGAGPPSESADGQDPVAAALQETEFAGKDVSDGGDEPAREKALLDDAAEDKQGKVDSPEQEFASVAVPGADTGADADAKVDSGPDAPVAGAVEEVEDFAAREDAQGSSDEAAVAGENLIAGEDNAPGEEVAHSLESLEKDERSDQHETSAHDQASETSVGKIPRTAIPAEDVTEPSASDASGQLSGKTSKKKSKKEPKKERKSKSKQKVETLERSESAGIAEKPKLKKGKSKLRFRVFRRKGKEKEEEAAVPKSKSVGAVPTKEKKSKKEKKERKEKREKRREKKEKKTGKVEEPAAGADRSSDQVVAEDNEEELARARADELGSLEQESKQEPAVREASADQAAYNVDAMGANVQLEAGQALEVEDEDAASSEEAQEAAVGDEEAAPAPGGGEEAGAAPEDLQDSAAARSAEIEPLSASADERLEEPANPSDAGASPAADATAEAATEPAAEPAVELAASQPDGEDAGGDEPANVAEAVAEEALEEPAAGAQEPSCEEAAGETSAAEEDAIASGAAMAVAQGDNDAQSGEGTPRAISAAESGNEPLGAGSGAERGQDEADVAPAPEADGGASVAEPTSDEERQQLDNTKRRRSLVHTFANLLLGSKAEDSHALKSPRGGRTKRKKGKHLHGDAKTVEGEGTASDGSLAGEEGAAAPAEVTPEPKRKGRSRMKFFTSSKSSKVKEDLRRNQTTASVNQTEDGHALPVTQSTSSLGNFAKKLRRSKKDLKKNQVEHDGDSVPVPAKMKSDMTVRTKEQPKLSKKERKALEKEEKAAAKAEKVERLAREKAEKAAAKAGGVAPAVVAAAATRSVPLATASDEKTPVSSDRGEGEREDYAGGDTDPDVPDPDDFDEGRPAEAISGRQRAASTLQEQIAMEGEAASSSLEGENAKALLAMKKAEENMPKSPFVDFAGSVVAPSTFVKAAALPVCASDEVDACAAMEESGDEGEQEGQPEEPEYGLEASLLRRKQKKAAMLAGFTPEERIKHDIMNKGYFQEKPFKIAAIGLSSRLFCLLSALFSNNPRRMQLVAVYENDEVMLKRAHERFGEEVNQAASVAELVSNNDIEWVLIGSMPKDQCKHISAAFKAGKHVFCEKPLGLSVRDTAEIYRAYKQSGCYFVTGHVQRSNPFYEDIHNLVRQGAIGKIVSVEANETLQPGEGGFFMTSSSSQRSETGPPLLDRQHDLDIISWIVGSSPARVAAFGGLSIFKPENKPSQEDAVLYNEWAARPANVPVGDPFAARKDVEDNQVVIIEYLNEVRATFHSNFNSALPQRRLLICGLRGTIEGDLLTGTIKFKTIAAGSEARVRQHTPGAAHGGGDQRLMSSLVDVMSTQSTEAAVALSSSAPQQSFINCLTALSVDQARAQRKVVELNGLDVDWRSLGIDLESVYKH